MVMWIYQLMTQQLTVGACSTALADLTECAQIASGWSALTETTDL